jgi:hypothetical protein
LRRCDVKKSKLLRITFFLLVISLVLASLAVLAAAQGDYDPNELSYGMYWFGKNGANQKFVPGESNSYFDPAKPTMIFVHGWQPYLSNSLPTFDFNGTDTAAGWIDGGWNIGIFVWNQFSDETTGLGAGDPDWFAGGPPQGVLDAEAKIWTTTGPQGMRWRDWDDFIDQYSETAGLSSAAELFYDEYVAAMPITYTGNIRIAGHSLGNQMAVRFTKLVHDNIAAGNVPENLRPARVALLDPYWSPGPKGYLDGENNGDRVRRYIAELLPTGTLFEWYWSSEWTTGDNGDSNDDLKPMVMYAAMDPQYAANGKDRHMAAQHHYFWSYAFDGPLACTGDDCLNMTKLLSKMSNAQLAAVMRSDYRWAQSAGQLTSSPDDDLYTSTQQLDAPYAVTVLETDTPTQTVGGVITVTATVTNTSGSVPTNTLVTFNADLGTISARSVTSNGVAIAHITSDVAGMAHISATTRGTGGVVQQTLNVTFTEAVSECITDAAISGPVDVTGTLYVNSLYTFNAVITPTGATQPITYTWSPTPTNGQNHNSATYRWSAPGTYTITLTVENCGEPVEAAPRVIVVADAQWRFVYLPLVLRNY